MNEQLADLLADNCVDTNLTALGYLKEIGCDQWEALQQICHHHWEQNTDFLDAPFKVDFGDRQVEIYIRCDNTDSVYLIKLHLAVSLYIDGQEVSKSKFLRNHTTDTRPSVRIGDNMALAKKLLRSCVHA